MSPYFLPKKNLLFEFIHDEIKFYQKKVSDKRIMNTICIIALIGETLIGMDKYIKIIIIISTISENIIAHT